MSINALSTWLGNPFARITASMRRGMEAISLCIAEVLGMPRMLQ